MARPIKCNLTYFKHDVGMRNDPKLRAVRNKFGGIGYAIYCMLIETLGESDLLQIEIDDMNCEIMASDFDIDTEKLLEMIEYFCRLKLMKLVNNILFCPALDKRAEPLFAKRTQNLDALRISENSDNSTEIPKNGIYAQNSGDNAPETLKNKVSDAETTENTPENCNNRVSASETTGNTPETDITEQNRKEKKRTDDRQDAHTRVEDAAAVASQEVSKATTIRNLLKSGFTEVEAAQLVTLHGEKRAAQDLDKALFAEKTGQLKGTITGFVAESLKTATGFTVKGWKPPAERAATAEAQKEREKAVAAQQKQATAAAQAERLKLNSLQDAFNRLPKDEQEQIARETIAAFEKASPFNRNLVQRYRESGESEIAIVNNHPFVTELRNAIMQKTEHQEA